MGAMEVNQVKESIGISPVPIKMKRLHPNAVVPLAMSEGAANFDWTVTEIERKGFMLIYKFGWAVEFPSDYKMILVPRSNLTGTGWAQLNSPGQIDADYRGEIQMRLWPIPVGVRISDWQPELVLPPEPYNVGERAAQGFLQRAIKVTMEEVDELSETKRGTGGFGSTGKK